MVTRQQRLDQFGSDGEPPSGEPVELLCEDHNGTRRATISRSLGRRSMEEHAIGSRIEAKWWAGEGMTSRTSG